MNGACLEKPERRALRKHKRSSLPGRLRYLPLLGLSASFSELSARRQKSVAQCRTELGIQAEIVLRLVAFPHCCQHATDLAGGMHRRQSNDLNECTVLTERKGSSAGFLHRNNEFCWLRSTRYARDGGPRRANIARHASDPVGPSQPLHYFRPGDGDPFNLYPTEAA
jgi:hypothetical protein